MKKVSLNSHTGLFLIELVIIILFFAISAAICMKLFVFSYVMTEQSSDISHAALAAQNTAECFKAVQGDITKTAELLGAAVENNTLSYHPTDDITLTLIAEEDTLEKNYSIIGKIHVTDNHNKIIFDMEVIALRGIGVNTK